MNRGAPECSQRDALGLKSKRGPRRAPFVPPHIVATTSPAIPALSGKHTPRETVPLWVHAPCQFSRIIHRFHKAFPIRWLQSNNRARILLVRPDIYGFSHCSVRNTTLFGRLDSGLSGSERRFQRISESLRPELHIFVTLCFDHDPGFRLSARITNDDAA